MIEFTEEQEKRAMRKDFRVWAELMVEAWYMSDYPNSTDYPAAQLVSDLDAVYLACAENNLNNVQQISFLGFAILRANVLTCSQIDIGTIIEYFCKQAREGNAEFGQRWIEMYLEGAV